MNEWGSNLHSQWLGTLMWYPYSREGAGNINLLAWDSEDPGLMHAIPCGHHISHIFSLSFIFFFWKQGHQTRNPLSSLPSSMLLWVFNQRTCREIAVPLWMKLGPCCSSSLPSTVGLEDTAKYPLCAIISLRIYGQSEAGKELTVNNWRARSQAGSLHLGWLPLLIRFLLYLHDFSSHSALIGKIVNSQRQEIKEATQSFPHL